MKQRLLALAWAFSLLFVAPHVGYAQLSEGSGATQGLSGAWLTNALTGTVEGTRDDLPEKGLHHKHVRWVQRVTNEVGETLDVTNSYVHMQPGLHYLTTNGQLAESRPVFEIKDGVAIANRMQFKVRIGGNIASAGYLEVAMPDGRKLRSHLGALRYFDPVSGQAAIISTVKPTQAYIVGDNQVVFPNAFSNVTADVRYTISVAGIEQDVLVHPEAPLPAPEDFGLPSATARLEVISEFLNPPATLRRSSTNDPSATRVTRGGVLSRLRAEDIDIDFGSMQIGEGSAFKVGSGTNGPPITVGKRWLRLNSAGQVAAESETAARQFLIEAVDVVAVEPVLPGESTTPGGAMLKRSGNRNVLVQSDFQAIPPLRESSNEEASVRRDPPASLLAALAGPLLVLDYVEQLNTGTHNNFTFLSGLTYFISGNHDFTGTTVLEGGAVIKMELWPQNTTPQHQMVIHGPVVCKTSASLPLIITARDDDTVGAVHASSTGTVTYGYGTYGLYFAWDSPAVELKYIHFAHLTMGAAFFNGKANRLLHSQFFKGGHPVLAGSGSSIYVGNVVMQQGNDLCGIGSGGTGVFEHVTSDRCNQIHPNYFAGGTFTLRNCLVITGATSSSDLLDWLDGGGNKWASSTNGLFVGAYGGFHYLPTSSPYRNAGVSGIDSALATDLSTTMTTEAPHGIASTITTDTILQPVVSPDTGLYDVGFHYPLIDYACQSTVVTGATVTLTNGVSLIYAYGSAFSLREGAKLYSTGSANKLNKLLHYRLVQESAISGESSWTVFSSGAATVVHPVVSLRYTEANMFGGSSWGGLISFGLNSGQQSYRPVGTFRAQDCHFANMWIYAADGTTDPISYTFFNNVLKGGQYRFYKNSGAYNQDTPMSVTFQNNLFYYSVLTFAYSQTTVNPTWLATDNVFDQSTFNYWVTTSLTPSPVTADYNGFANTTVAGNGANNKPTSGTVNATYVTGPLGRWYSTTANWVNAGSRSAGAAGLYHYSTQADQTPEGATTVDLGFHYLATKGSSDPTPRDSDNDGIADYREDPAGTGATTGGTSLGGTGTAWNNADTDNDGLLDGAELTRGTDPLNPDSDFDGVTDGAEVAGGMDPLNIDSDFDGTTDGAEVSDGTNPADPNSVKPKRLALWDFNNAAWSGDSAQSPSVVLSTANALSWDHGVAPLASGSTQFLGSVEMGTAGNDTTVRKLAYKFHEGAVTIPAYRMNLAPLSGAVRFWFRPNWSSKSLGELGNSRLTTEARLLTVGSKVATGTYTGYWSLSVRPSGSASLPDKLHFEAQYPGNTSASFDSSIVWKWGEWHQIALTYGMFNGHLSIGLFVDGEMAERINGFTMPFSAPNMFGGSFAVGSENDGSLPARGRFDRLETFNNPLSVLTMRADFKTAMAVDTDSDGLADIREDTFGTDPSNSDSDGDLMGDKWEAAYALRQPNGTYLTSATVPPNTQFGPNPTVGDASAIGALDGITFKAKHDNHVNPLAKSTAAMMAVGGVPPRKRLPTLIADPATLISVDFTSSATKTANDLLTTTGAAGLSGTRANSQNWNIFRSINADSPDSDAVKALREAFPLADADGNPSGVSLRVGRGPYLMNPDHGGIDDGSFSCVGIENPRLCFVGHIWKSRKRIWREAWTRDTQISLPACFLQQQWDPDDSANMNVWWAPQMYWWDGGIVDAGMFADELGYPYAAIGRQAGKIPFSVYALDKGAELAGVENYDVSALPDKIADYLYTSFDCSDCWDYVGHKYGGVQRLSDNTVIVLSGLEDGSTYRLFVASVASGAACVGTPGISERPVFVTKGIPNGTDFDQTLNPTRYEGSERSMESFHERGWSAFRFTPERGQIRIVLPAPAVINALQLVKLPPPPPQPPPSQPPTGNPNPGTGGGLAVLDVTASAVPYAIKLDWEVFWEISDPDTEGFLVFRGPTANGPWHQLEYGPFPGHYEDTQVSPWASQTYYYIVYAYSHDAIIAGSPVVSATTTLTSSHDVNVPPVLSSAKPLEGSWNRKLIIPLARLLGTTDAFDADGDPLQVQITKIYAGHGTLELFHGQSTTAANITDMMVAGDHLEWTPPPRGESTSAQLFDVFDMRVSDGNSFSRDSVAVPIFIDKPKALLGWGSGANGGLGDGSLKFTFYAAQLEYLDDENAGRRADPTLVLTRGSNGQTHAILDPRDVADTLSYGYQSFKFGVTDTGVALGWGTMFDDKDPKELQWLDRPWGLKAPYSGFYASQRTVLRWAIQYAQPIYRANHENLLDNPPRPLTGVLRIAASSSAALALLEDGTVWLWGGVNEPKPEDWTIDEAPSLPVWSGTKFFPQVLPALPNQVPYLDGIVDIAMDDQAAIALKSDGTLWWWGVVQAFNQWTGDGISVHTLPDDKGDILTPNRLNFVDENGDPILFKSVAAKAGYYLGVARDGSVWEWGLALRDDIKHTSTGMSLANGLSDTYWLGSARRVENLSGVKSVATTGMYSLALLDDGTVKAWGVLGSDGNPWEYGSLLHLTVAWISREPAPLRELSDIVQISTGLKVFFAVRKDGRLFGWGDNRDKQLMSEETGFSTPVPILMSGVKNVKYVFAGDVATFAAASVVDDRPVGLLAEGRNNRINLRWNPFPGALRYIVKRLNRSTDVYDYLATVGSATTTSYSDVSVLNGTTYSYVVSAVYHISDEANAPDLETPNSLSVNGTPVPAPSGTINNLLVAAGCHAAALWWTDPNLPPLEDVTKNGIYYKIIRVMPNGNESVVGQALPDSGSLNAAVRFTDEGLVDGTYQYKVIRSNPSGDGEPSAVSAAVSVSGSTCLPPPQALAATQSSIACPDAIDTTSRCATVILTWLPPDLAAAGIVGTVERYTINANMRGKPGKRAPSTVKATAEEVQTWTDYVVDFDLAKTYTVSATVKVQLDSGESDYVYIETQATPVLAFTTHGYAQPGPVKNLKALSGNGVVMLTWDEELKSASYVVEVSYNGGSTWSVLNWDSSVQLDDTSWGGTHYFWHLNQANGTGRMYRVHGVTFALSGDLSNTASTTPSLSRPLAPQPGQLCTGTTLCGSAVAYDSKIVIRWPTPDGSLYPKTWNFFVQRRIPTVGSQPASPWEVISDMGFGLTYGDDEVANGFPYQYRVVGFDENGNRVEWTSEVMTPQASPIGFVAIAGNRRVTLKWVHSEQTESSDLKYFVSRSLSPAGPGEVIGSFFSQNSDYSNEDGTLFIFIDGKVENGKDYYYSIEAVAGSGTVFKTPFVGATPSEEAPPARPGVEVEFGPLDGQVSVRWVPTTGTLGVESQFAWGTEGAPPVDSAPAWAATSVHSYESPFMWTFTPPSSCNTATPVLWVRTRGQHGNPVISRSEWTYRSIDYCTWKAEAQTPVVDGGAVQFIDLPTQVTTPTNVVLRVSANVASVVRVHFLVDGDVIGSVPIVANDTPVQWTWYKAPAGSHSVQAYAVNDKGLVTESALQVVTVTWATPLTDYTTSVADLQLPAPGLPIALNRSYSSAVSAPSSDLGQGWVASWMTPRLEVAAGQNLAQGWKLGNPVLSEAFPVLESGPHRVSVISLSGQEIRFRPFVPGYANPANSALIDGTLAFAAEDPLSGYLAIERAEHLAITGDSGGVSDTDQLNVDDFLRFLDTPDSQDGFDIFRADTRSFTYYSPDGTMWTFSPLPDGLPVSPTGPSVWRLTSVSDQAQNRQVYTYYAPDSTDPVEKGNRGRLKSITAYTEGGGDTAMRTVTFDYLPAIADTAMLPVPPTQVLAYDSIESDATRSTDLKMPSVRYVINRPVGGTPTLTEVDRLVTRKTTGTTPAQYAVTRYEYDATGLTYIKQVPVLVPAVDKAALAAYTPSSLLTLLKNVYSGGKLANQTDARGHMTTLAFGTGTTAHTASVSQTFADGSTTTTVTSQIEIGPDGLPTATVDPTQTGLNPADQKKTKVDFDAQGRPIQTTAPDGSTTATTYDSYGRPDSVTDAQGNTSSVIMDPNGRPELTTDKNGNTSTVEYTGLGAVARQEDAAGQTTAYEYNDARFPDLPTRVETGPSVAGSTVTESTYTAHGELASQKLYLDATQTTFALTEYSYDGNGNPVGQVQYRTIDGASTPMSSTTVVDALGRAVSTTDALSRPPSTTTYDAFGRAVSSKDVYGRITKMTYDAVGNLVQTIYPDGTLTRTVYDEANRPVFVQDRMAPSATILADAQVPAQTTATTAPGTLTQYDGVGRAVASLRYQSMVVTLQPDTVAGNSQVYTSKSTPGTVTSTSRTVYDVSGRVSFRIDPLGGLTGYVYDSLGRVTAETRYTPAVPQYLVAGTSVSIAGLTPYVTTFGYDANGNRLWVVDANNQSAAGTDPSAADHWKHRTSYVYDEAGRLVQTISPAVSSEGNAQKVRITRYDPVGQKISETDENGVVTVYSYDPAGRLTAVTQDYHEVPVSGTYPQTTRYQYDEVGNLIAVRDAMNGFTVDGNGALSAITPATAADNRVIRYEYDHLGRRTKTTLPLAGTETVPKFESTLYGTLAVSGTSYSVQSNRFTGLDTKVTTLLYDLMDRPVLRKPDASLTGEVPVTFGYDSAGRRAWMEDASGHTTYNYDTEGHLTRKTTAAGTLAYQYDGGGRLLSMATGPYGPSSVAYAYDGLNRLQSVVNTPGSNAKTTSYTYDNVGNLSSILYPNGITHNYAYTEQYRLKSVQHSLSTGPTTSVELAHFNYTLDPAGRRTQLVEILPPVSGQVTPVESLRVYRYDTDSFNLHQVFPNLGRLTSDEWHTGADISSSLQRLWNFRYDRVGSRLAQHRWMDNGTPTGNVANISIAYNQRDEPVNDSRGSAPVFDANRNEVRFAANDVDGVAPSDQTSDDVYNFENQLKTAVRAIAGSSPTDYATYRMVYDGDGNRVSKTTSASTSRTTLYLVDDRNPSGYAQVIEETTLAPAPVSGLVGRWSFNEGAGTNVSDISGNGRHGINAQASGWVSAVLGSGLKSVAGAPQVSIPHHSSLTAGNVMTVTFWMRKNAEGTSRLVGKGISSAVENYGVWTDTADGKLRFKFYSGSGAQAVSGTTSLAQNQWYHVAVELNATAAAGSVKFFINGVLESTQIVNGFPVTSSDPLTIGYAGYGSGFSGDMDDVCLYNRLLTDSEISGLADRTGAGVNCRYTLGTQLISQERRTDGSSSTWTASYYGHDGLGSTRALYNASGVATDTYNYTAYGKMMLQLYPISGSPTVNNYLFAGEQWDPDLKLYYNRARYLNVDSGRFTSRDTFEGGAGDTANLHRYLYVGGDPVNESDPNGHEFNLISLNFVGGEQTTMRTGNAGATTRPMQIGYSIQRWNAAVSGFQSGVNGSMLYKGAAAGIIGISIALPLATAALAVADSTGAEMQSAREKLHQQVLVEAQKQGCGGPLLFYYSNAPKIARAWGSGMLDTSRGIPPDFPQGGYASDIPPWDIRYTQSQLAYGFYDSYMFDARCGGVQFFIAFCGNSEWKPLAKTISPGIIHFNKRQAHPSLVEIKKIAVGVNLMPDN